MNPKKSIENRVQVGAEGRKRATDLVTNLPHEAQQALTTDSPTSWELWRLSLVLKEIAENLEPHGDEKQPPRLIPAKDGDGGCKYGEKRNHFYRSRPITN